MSETDMVQSAVWILPFLSFLRWLIKIYWPRL